ncbi:hypothetical protein BZA05DRAFT_411658 [Tricharina praecox]|uniref:uncharacterized protein n=1 Tax=Tricharina praecox TaxID=43433 RepID=UPI00221F346D|nr:uncharacterized protein BZA05DRAFT_411658 [Tricharina praecox]KAI5842852.1 hypothetical protein BZA05DRAFT_411658 [Tricharina praecox]
MHIQMHTRSSNNEASIDADGDTDTGADIDAYSVIVTSIGTAAIYFGLFVASLLKYAMVMVSASAMGLVSVSVSAGANASASANA